MEDPERPIGPEEAALAAEAEELRRQVLAGAGSQEELRLLAERLRSHREHEDDVWRRNVRPALKGPSGDPQATRNVVAMVVVAVVVVGLIAAVIVTNL